MTRALQLFLLAIGAMTLLVAASNYLVQFPIGDWWTWGAVTYPFAFLVTDLTNRTLGPATARKVVYIGFALAVVLSLWLATPRIALASGSTFLIAQLLDIYIFNQLRAGLWWKAPLVSSVLAAAVDTFLFFCLAFVATDVPWIQLAIGDFGAKLALVALSLLPYRLLMPWLKATPQES